VKLSPPTPSYRSSSTKQDSQGGKTSLKSRKFRIIIEIILSQSLIFKKLFLDLKERGQVIEFLSNNK